MNQIQRVLTQLQDLLDVLVGFRPFQPLPQAFFEQPDWHEAEQARQLPAVWRRTGRY